MRRMTRTKSRVAAAPHLRAGSDKAQHGGVDSAARGLRWGWVLAGLFAAALLWRLAYLARLDRSVLGGSLVSDAETYWMWATWLLDHSWWGKHPFFMGPLYPYSVAGIRALLGGTAAIQPVLVLQAIGGAAAVVLLADAVRRATGSRAIGVAIGARAALYETAVFFDGLVLMESQLFALEALLVWTVVALGRPGGPAARALLGLGALVGLIATGRASSLVLLPVLALVLAPGWRGLAWLVAGFALVAAPVAGRNLAIGGEWIPFTYNGGFNLAIGYGPEANGTFVHVTGTQVVTSSREPEGVSIDGREYIRLTTGRDLSPAASSAYWSARARAWIAAHPGRALELTGRRLLLLWNRVEMPQVDNIAEFRLVAGPLGLPWAGTFALLGPFALLGLGVVLARWRASARGVRFVAAYAVAMTLVILPFFVTDRYRHHLVPAAFVLAAVAIAALVAGWRARASRALALALAPLAVGLAIGAVIVHLPAPGLSAAKLEWGIASDLGARYLARGQLLQARHEFERALAIERSGALARGAGSSRAFERAALYHNYAIALERSGRLDEAGRWYEAALAEAPGNAQIMQGLAGLRARQGRTGEAEQQYEAMGGRVQGGAPPARSDAGNSPRRPAVSTRRARCSARRRGSIPPRATRGARWCDSRRRPDAWRLPSRRWSRARPPAGAMTARACTGRSCWRCAAIARGRRRRGPA